MAIYMAICLVLPACQPSPRTTSLSTLTAATGVTKVTAVTGSRIGNAAPDFNLQDTDNQPVKLSTLLGKPVFITFWSIE
jgi:cytochrome oxidase Cu insertion factor (SCO1/SenC/PrrC family)